MEAKNQPLAGILGDDLKHVLAVIGYDLSDVTITFEISAGPEQPAIIPFDAAVLDVSVDDDGVPTSVIELFAAADDVRTAIDDVGGLPGNEPLTLFYQLRFDELPGDAGTAAKTTILFGDYTMEGAVNG